MIEKENIPIALYERLLSIPNLRKEFVIVKKSNKNILEIFHKNLKSGYLFVIEKNYYSYSEMVYRTELRPESKESNYCKREFNLDELIIYLNNWLELIVLYDESCFEYGNIKLDGAIEQRLSKLKMLLSSYSNIDNLKYIEEIRDELTDLEKCLDNNENKYIIKKLNDILFKIKHRVPNLWDKIKVKIVDSSIKVIVSKIIEKLSATDILPFT